MEERDWPPTIAHDPEEFWSPLKELTEKRTNYDPRGAVVGERAARSDAAAVCIALWRTADTRGGVPEPPAGVLRQIDLPIIKRAQIGPEVSRCCPSAGSSKRTIAWLNRRRRLAKDWENLNRKALAFLRLAAIRLMLRNSATHHDVPGQTLLGGYVV